MIGIIIDKSKYTSVIFGKFESIKSFLNFKVYTVILGKNRDKINLEAFPS